MLRYFPPCSFSWLLDRISPFSCLFSSHINLIISPVDSKLRTKRLEHLCRCCSGSLWLLSNKILTVLLHLYRIYLLRYLHKILLTSGRILRSFNVVASIYNNEENLDNTKYRSGAKSYFIKNQDYNPCKFLLLLL